MSDTIQLSLDDHDKLNNNILCVKGVLDLIFAAISGDFASTDPESIQALINDAQDKLDEVRGLL